MKPFNAHPGEIASAVIDYTFGRKHTFICDNCKAENILTKDEYEAVKDAQDKPAPATPVASGGAKPVAKPVAAAPKPIASAPKPEPKPVAAAPKPAAQPVAAPKPVIAHSEPVEAKPVAAPQPKEGTVVVDSLRIRKDHNTSAEVVAGLAYGNKVTILGTWTDGKNTWAQIGPDQWAAIEHNGKKMIEVA
jgi:hypothetical protein